MKTLHSLAFTLPLIATSLLFAPGALAQGAPTYAVNQRTPIEVNAVEHAHLLTEMNAFMTALHEINVALAQKDFAKVIRVATAMGPKGGQHDPVGQAVHAKLPPEWFALARPTHQNFMAIAQEARAKPSVDTLLPRLAATSQQCVACHATYRLSVKP